MNYKMMIPILATLLVAGQASANITKTNDDFALGKKVTDNIQTWETLKASGIIVPNTKTNVVNEIEPLVGANQASLGDKIIVFASKGSLFLKDNKPYSASWVYGVVTSVGHFTTKDELNWLINGFDKNNPADQLAGVEVAVGYNRKTDRFEKVYLNPLNLTRMLDVSLHASWKENPQKGRIEDRFFNNTEEVEKALRKTLK